MEEKKIFWRDNPLWAIFSVWYRNKFILGRFSFAKNYQPLFLKSFQKGFTTTSSHSRGFTFVELLILGGVLLALGTLMADTFHPLQQIQQYNDKKRITDFTHLQRALEVYYQKRGFYPASSTDFQILSGKNALQWGQDEWVPYFGLLPNDPFPEERKYVYYSDRASNNQSYWLYTSLENGQNPKACGHNCSLGNGAIPPNACGTNTHIMCNYGVSSSNVSP